jgi:hypothetical protein
MEYIIFISLTGLAILAQIPNAYYVFRRFSRLSGTLKEIQAVAFCLILSIAIFGFVWIGRPELALLGAIIESIINVYYYTGEFWKSGFNLQNNRRYTIKQQVGRFWRYNWVAMIVLAIGMPTFIYVFSEILVNL